MIATKDNKELKHSSSTRDFYIDVLFTPQKVNSRQPVFLFDRFTSLGPILGRKNSRCSLEFRADESSAYRAGCDPNVRVVSDPLVLSRIAAGHDAELFVFFAEPEWGIDGDSILAKTGKGNIFLASNFGRDGHRNIV